MVPPSRRQFLWSSVALAGVSLLTGCGLPPLPWHRPSRIGYLGGGSSGPYPALLDAFRQGLRELGYVDGQTLAIEYRFIDHFPARAPAFAAELIGLDLDLLVAHGAAHVGAVKGGTSVIPIVGVP